MWKLIEIMFISAVPVIEQRGAIPLGIIVYDLNPFAVFLASFFGSLIPSPFILVFFNIVFEWMKKIKIFNKFNKYIEHKLDKGKKHMEKYKKMGLIIFVGIPLPVTGVWTGSAVASFLKMDLKKSFLHIALGALISAIAITILCFVFPALVGY